MYQYSSPNEICSFRLAQSLLPSPHNLSLRQNRKCFDQQASYTTPSTTSIPIQHFYPFLSCVKKLHRQTVAKRAPLSQSKVFSLVLQQLQLSTYSKTWYQETRPYPYVEDLIHPQRLILLFQAILLTLRNPSFLKSSTISTFPLPLLWHLFRPTCQLLQEKFRRTCPRSMITTLSHHLRHSGQTTKQAFVWRCIGRLATTGKRLLRRNFGAWLAQAESALEIARWNSVTVRIKATKMLSLSQPKLKRAISSGLPTPTCASQSVDEDQQSCWSLATRRISGKCLLDSSLMAQDLISSLRPAASAA